MNRSTQTAVSITLAFLVIASIRLSAQEVDPARLTLDQVVGDDFEAKSFGPAVWLKNSAAYSVYESLDDGNDNGNDNSDDGDDKGDGGKSIVS